VGSLIYFANETIKAFEVYLVLLLDNQMPISPSCANTSADAVRVKYACVGRGVAATWAAFLSSATQDGTLLKDGTRRSLSGFGVLEAGMAAEAAGERDSSMGPQPLPAREMLPPRRRPVAAVHHT